MTNLEKLIQKLKPENTKLNEPLSKHTNLKIGGPADIFYTPKTTNELIEAVEAARMLEVPITMLGWGANSLVGDRGIRGLVIRNHSKQIIIGDEKPYTEKEAEDEEIIARWAAAGEEEGGRKMYDFADLDYDESDKPIVEVKMDSGVDLPFAINYLIKQGLTGLQWYGRIPATIGGAVFNNIHGGTHHIDELIKDVKVLAPNNEVITLSKEEIGAGYDESRFHTSGEIILNVTFNLRRGDAEKAKYVATEWTKRKYALQPSNSCGCIFKNISNEEKEQRGWPTGSVGYIIEHQLKMTGFSIGDAEISSKHHNFIENKGNATAKDYLAVIQEIQKRAKEQLNITLEPEIFYLGEF